MEGHKSFEDIKAWQLGRSFRKEIYDITKKFPEIEKYVLTAQIRRAAISITANLAEGYGRFFYQENIQFCRVSRGSVNEVIDHLYTALDEAYISKEEFNRLYKEARIIEKAINGYISFLKSQKGQK